MKTLFIALFLLQLAAMGMSLQRFHTKDDGTSAVFDMTIPARHVAAGRNNPAIQAIQRKLPAEKPVQAVQVHKPAPSMSNSIMNLLGLGSQLGSNYTEMDEILSELATILADLQAQDDADDALLAAKTANHTAAVAATGAANASLAAAQTAHTAAEATLAADQATLSSTTDAADASIALCISELSYASNMQTALDSLHAVGAAPEELIAIGNMASKLTTVHPSAVADFQHSVSLIQRPYTDASTAVQSGIDNLIVAINQKRTDAEQTVTDAQAVVDASTAAVAAAAANVVVMETRQAAAMTAEYAALQDLLTTTSDVAASKAETDLVRQAVVEIQNELAGLGDVENTESFAQVMLNVGSSPYSTILSRIQMHILGIITKIDTEDFAEQSARMNRMSEWNALQLAEAPLIEDSNVKTAALATLDTNIAHAQGVLDAANTALNDEISGQLREEAFFAQLRTLLETLPGIGGEGGEVALQVERDHNDFNSQFESLITALQAAMVTRRSSLEADRDRDAADHTTLVNSRVAVALAAEAAETAEQNAIAATAAAQSVYMTANDRYNANRLLRDEERGILMNLQTLITNLGSM